VTVDRPQWHGAWTGSWQGGHANGWQGRGHACEQERSRWHGSPQAPQPFASPSASASCTGATLIVMDMPWLPKSHHLYSTSHAEEELWAWMHPKDSRSPIDREWEGVAGQRTGRGWQGSAQEWFPQGSARPHGAPQENGAEAEHGLCALQCCPKQLTGTGTVQGGHGLSWAGLADCSTAT
jgi:hypothetical protein